MKIRRGNYTIHNGVELAIYAVRYESPTPGNKVPYSICYSADLNLGLDGFTKDPFEDKYCKNIYLNELTNAFYVQTFGLYNGMVVEVFEFRPDPNIVYITTSDKTSIEKHSFLDMGREYGKDVPIVDLEKIWELRRPTIYNLPMPNGLNEVEEI